MKEIFFKILFQSSKKSDWESKSFFDKCISLISESDIHKIYAKYAANRQRDFKKELADLFDK